MSVKVSFIIPHKGREELLVQTVASILAQDIDSTIYDIWVITQNKSLPELSELSTLHKNVHILFQKEELTISALRNIGATQTESEYLTFLDADIELSANWLTCMLQTINERNNCLLTSAAQINGKNAPPLERIRTALSNAELDCEVNFLPGRNLLLTRETFNKVNGFPEHLITCEDYYFTDQIHQLGNLYYTSKATYVHLGEDKKYREMYKKEIWRGQSNLQSIKGRNIPLREIPSFIVPLGLAVLFIIFLSTLFMEMYSVSSSSLVLFSLPIIAYTFRLHKLTKDDVSIWHVFQFYLMYFPARAIGTLGGLFKSFSNSGIK